MGGGLEDLCCGEKRGKVGGKVGHGIVAVGGEGEVEDVEGDGVWRC